jgi:hypothetical protein
MLGAKKSTLSRGRITPRLSLLPLCGRKDDRGPPWCTRSAIPTSRRMGTASRRSWPVRPHALLSHTSAAWLWGLLRRHPGAIHVTSPTRRRVKPPLSVHHARLAPDDRTICEGIPVTALPRTLLDLAAILPAERLRRAIERSEELGLFDLRPVDALLARAGGHPGVGRLHRALTLYRSPAFTRSGLERRFLELVREAGLPALR